MYQRLLEPPDHSFFLFGPRATGKTTWLKQEFPTAKWFDLLRASELLRLRRQPELLRQEVEALKPRTWVVIDEVQKHPALLDEVHSLIADHGSRYRFALSGSSARRLKRLDANLLAGRVINKLFLPLTGKEMGFAFDTDDILAFGCLPQLVADQASRVEVLEAYAANYIREEIQQETMIRNVDGFTRFLDVAALMNGQVVNVAGIARDAAVARPTVARYFETLVDTLIGFWVPAWQPRARVKEVAHPKFYFFDCGVARVLSGRVRERLEGAERGPLLETLVCHELRAHMNIANTGGQIAYWRTPSQSEVDFVWSRGSRRVGIEVKAAVRWRSGDAGHLKGLLDSKAIHAGYGVYLGSAVLKDGPVTVLPLKSFMERLSEGEIIP